MRNVLRSIRCGSPRSLAWRLLAVAVAASFAATPPATAVDLQGHRGARGLAPENTLAGFRRAIEIGVTTLETDLALTADDRLVLSHDPALNRALTRTGDGRWLSANGPPIRSLTSTALRAYDVGRIDPSHEYAKPWTQQVAVDGERIPTLSELFALARDARSPGGRPVHFNLETKLTPTGAVPTASADEFARAVAREVAAAGMAERVTVQSFDWRTLRALKRIAPSDPHRVPDDRGEVDGHGARGRERSIAVARWTEAADHGGSLPRTVQAAGCAAWSPFWRNLTPELVAEARGLGLAVVPWTVNEPADIERMLDLGVDGLITDYPDRARGVLAKRGVPVD